MSASAVTSEAVLFFEKQGVTKSMLYSDFEAILDGMVGIPEYAGKELHVAYCQVTGKLKIHSVVLFCIDFDEDGMADSSWNIPLRHLAEHGAPGPDMGAGPIRLACRSQCPVAWHQDQLWDPNMKPGANDFVAMRDTIQERGKKLGLELDEADDAGGAGMAAGSVPPVVQAERGRSADPAEEKERLRLARTIKELRLRIQTMENTYKEEVAKLRYAKEQKEEILSAQLEKVLSQFKAIKSQNRALKEQNESLKGQVMTLNRSLEEQSREKAEQGSEAAKLNEQYKLAMEQRLEEERARLDEQLHAKEMEVLLRDEQIGQLNASLAELKRNKIQEANTGAQKTLQRLEELGLSFIAFHPGAGHISVSADQVGEYIENPIAFAARKCLVTEDHYRAWLKHYENPVCQVPVGPNGEICGKRVIRVEVPNQFKPGSSDRNSNRCTHCQSDTSIDNVLKFR